MVPIQLLLSVQNTTGVAADVNCFSIQESARALIYETIMQLRCETDVTKPLQMRDSVEWSEQYVEGNGMVFYVWMIQAWMRGWKWIRARRECGHSHVQQLTFTRASPSKPANQKRMRPHRLCRASRMLWFVWDPAGIVIALFAGLLVFGLLVAVLMSISQWVGLLSPMGVTEGIWFTGLFGLCLWSHVVVLTSNPGTVPSKLKGIMPSVEAGEEGTKDDDELEEVEEEMPLNEFEECEDDGSLLIYCDECAIYRPLRAVHCHICKRCIVMQDHHCPWVNNCVGIGNQKAFLLLLLYVTATSVQAALLVLMQYAMCSRGKYSCGFQSDQFPGKLGSWILAAAAVFGLFCSLMLAMELLNVYQDPLFTLIADQLAARRGGDKSTSTLERNLSVICGTDGMKASWLFPPPERRSLHDVEIIQGFRCRSEDGVC